MPRFDADYVPASAMSIFAHPDDAEFGVAGTLARWARAGCEVTMVLCTSGNVGTQDTTYTPGTLAETREREQRAAAELLGVRNVVFLHHDDCQLAPTLELRRALVRTIRQHRPEVVISGDPAALFMGQSYINHPDHRAAAVAALDAVFPCAEMPLLWPEDGPPHKVHAVYIAWTDARDVWIDVGDTIETKIAALKAHASQMGDWDPAEMIREWASGDAAEGRKKQAAAARKARRTATATEEEGAATGDQRPASVRATYAESFRVMVLQRDEGIPES
jgi:LmbE family N-acetylglucosaminyl deacetylase